MNNSRKYIWSVYVIIWIYFFFFDSSLDQSSHIFTFLIFGWIPFLILHFLWKNKHNENDYKTMGITQDQSIELNKAMSLKKQKIISNEEFEKIKQKILNIKQ